MINHTCFNTELPPLQTGQQLILTSGLTNTYNIVLIKSNTNLKVYSIDHISPTPCLMITITVYLQVPRMLKWTLSAVAFCSSEHQ